MHALTTTETMNIAATRLRGGHHDDIPAVCRLMGRANKADRAPHIDEQELEAIAALGHLIDLQLGPTEIDAAVCVAAGRGVVFLVLDPDVASPELEHRMIGVADALCESEIKRPACGGGRVAYRGRR